MKKKPVAPVEGVVMDLSLGRRITDWPTFWKDGITMFQDMAEGRKDFPDGKWFVAMGYPPEEYLSNKTPPRIHFYDKGWAALYKDSTGTKWMVRADRYAEHPETGHQIWEAHVFPLNPPGGSKEFWYDEYILASTDDQTSFDVDSDAIEGLNPALWWAEGVIMEPGEMLVREWQRGKRKRGKKNPKGGAGILFVHKNKMLLMRRSDQVKNPYQWGIPGGGAERGESSLQTAIRETEEEAGRQAAAYVAHGEYGQRGTVRYLHGPLLFGAAFTTFLCLVPHEFKPKLNWEHDDWAWVTRKQADRMKLHKGVRQMLREGI